MKLFAPLLLLLTGCAAPAMRLASPAKVPASDLESGKASIVGVLGKELGTVARIEAVVVPLPSRPVAGLGYGQEYGLRIEKIDGAAVERPPVVQFEVNDAYPIRVAPHEAGLKHLLEKLGAPGQFFAPVSAAETAQASPLSPDAIDSIRKNYLGSRHDLIVYETARFGGVPRGVPDGYSMGFEPSPSYAVRLHLVVFGEK